MLSRKTLLLLGFIFALTSCGPPPPLLPPDSSPTAPVLEDEPFTEDNSLPTGPTSLWIGWVGGPDSPNPFTAQWSDSYTIFDMVYSSLFRLQPDGSYSPDLVESVVVSEDELTWIFQIRSGVLFHDGEPLTARDVAFSLNLYGSVGEATAFDDTTVEIQLLDPVPNMEGHLNQLYIIPQHKWARYESALDSFDNLEMVGSGPFRMVAYQQDSFVYLQAVPDHYLYPPKIEDAVYLVYDDEQAIIEALVTGEVDLITKVPYSEIETLSRDSNIDVVTGWPLYASFEEIIFNQIDPANCPPIEAGGVCSGHPALRDRNVRLAMAHGIDKSVLIDEILLGYGDPGVSMIPSGMEFFYNPNIRDYAYDPDLANQILDQAGYLDTNEDGIREMPRRPDELVGQAGEPLRFRFFYLGPSILYTQLADRLSEMWGQIGIALDIQEMDASTLTALCCPAFDYDMMVWAWEVNPEPGFIFDMLSSSQLFTGYNETGYSNPFYDILNAVQHSEVDPTKRQATIWELQQIAHEDVVQIVLFYARDVSAFRSDRFTGWVMDAPFLVADDFHSMIQIEPVK